MLVEALVTEPAIELNDSMYAFWFGFLGSISRSVTQRVGRDDGYSLRGRVVDDR